MGKVEDPEGLEGLGNMGYRRVFEIAKALPNPPIAIVDGLSKPVLVMAIREAHGIVPPSFPKMGRKDIDTSRTTTQPKVERAYETRRSIYAKRKVIFGKPVQTRARKAK